jgi:hypothetical protein
MRVPSKNIQHLHWGYDVLQVIGFSYGFCGRHIGNWNFESYHPFVVIMIHKVELLP